MANLNKVMLMGHLTRDPINKSTMSGLIICEFGLATNRRFKTAQGEDREEVCYVDLEAFGKTAEICGRYLHKGSPVYIEGRLKFDQWQDKATGQNRNRLRVTVETMQLLERRQDGVGGNPQNTSFDNMGYAMPPPMNMPPPGAYNPPPPPRQTVPPAAAVQDIRDEPPFEQYEEEASEQDPQF
jgi:single-strand DNA-binding protein